MKDDMEGAPRRASQSVVASMLGALAMSVSLTLTAAAATPLDDQKAMLDHVALAIAAYRSSADQCYYDPKDGKIFDDADTLFTRRLPDVWPRLRDSAPDMLPMLKNTARLAGATSDCVALSTSVGLGLVAALYTGQFDAAVGAEMDRLTKGGGRGKSDPAPAGPPAPPPRSAAETVKAMNAARAESDARADRTRAALAAEPTYPGYRAQGFAVPGQQAMVAPNPSALVGGVPARPATPRPGELAAATPPALRQRPAEGTQDAVAPGRSDSDQEPTGPAFSPARAAVSDCLKDVDLTHDKDSQFARCYEAGLTEQDARLNREFNKEKGSAANSGRTSALTAAQRAWISFRDSWCTYEAGSGQAPSPQVNRLSCLFDLTLDQADRLADSYRPD